MHRKVIFLTSLLAHGFLSQLAAMQASEAPLLIISTADAPWAAAAINRECVGQTSIVELKAPKAQTIRGFGGCFNEQGWQVLAALKPSQRREVLEALFSKEAGCGFTLGRMPMGANDYSLDWYSYAEEPEDYELKHFSIARDRKYLLPYIKAAKEIAPTLALWASPWCPPSWMKTNKHYAGKPAPVNDLRPEQAGEEMVTQFRMEPKILSAYAGYFSKFISAYEAEGIPITAVHVQNEPNSCQNFPSCVWRPEDLSTFISDYLGPRLAADHASTELWLGTIERPQLERVSSILDSSAGRFITGVGFQWDGKGAIPAVQARYPQLRLLQTETECGNGSNDWAAAEYTWSLIRHYLEHGAEAYMYWNLVLDETGNSRWGWRQNAMITVTRDSHEIRYNPEYQLMRHLAAFVARGARRLALSAGEADMLAFVNPNGTRTIVMANRNDTQKSYSIQEDGSSRAELTLPPRSFATLVLPQQD